MLSDWFPVILSIRVGFISVLIVTCIALPVARVMARQNFPGKGVVEAFITLPMVLPPSVVGYGLLMLIGKNGLLGKLLANIGITIIFTWWAAVLAAIVVSFPLMYQSVSAAFKSVDVNFENVARTLGASEVRIFFTITLPLALPGIIAGIVLSFARSMGEFGATLMVAGNIPGQTQTMPLAIYFAVEAGDNVTARALVGIITLFSFIVIYGVNRWKNKKDYER
jgi:molybdate transport system permease protein